MSDNISVFCQYVGYFLSNVISFFCQLILVSFVSPVWCFSACSVPLGIMSYTPVNFFASASINVFVWCTPINSFVNGRSQNSQVIVAKSYSEPPCYYYLAGSIRGFQTMLDEVLIRKQDGQAIHTFATSRSRDEWPTVVASLKLVACLVVEIIQDWIFPFADPLWSCIKVKVIETSIHTSTAMPRVDVIAWILSEIWLL